MHASVINTVSPTTDRQLSGSCLKQAKHIEREAQVGAPSELLPNMHSKT